MIISHQSDDGVYGAVETVAQGSHTLVRVGVVIAQDVVLQRRLHLRQVVAHPPITKSLVQQGVTVNTCRIEMFITLKHLFLLSNTS